MSRSEILAFALCAVAAPWIAQAQAAPKRTRRPPATAPVPSAPQEKKLPGQEAPGPEWTAPPNEGDTALLRGLLDAFAPAPREIRIIAAEDLALLGDPRALDPLAHLVFDRDPEVARAAVRAVTHFQHPRAEQMLANIIRHPALADALKVIAVEGVPFQRNSRVRELLAEIANAPALSVMVRNAARITLARMTAADPVTTR